MTRVVYDIRELGTGNLVEAGLPSQGTAEKRLAELDITIPKILFIKPRIDEHNFSLARRDTPPPAYLFREDWRG